MVKSYNYKIGLESTLPDARFGSSPVDFHKIISTINLITIEFSYIFQYVTIIIIITADAQNLSYPGTPPAEKRINHNIELTTPSPML